jgi:hypothetical protein
VNDRNLVRLTDETADLLARIALAIQTVDAQGCTVLDRIRAGYNGHPQAAHYDPDGRFVPAPPPRDEWPDDENPLRDSHLPSDPTGEAAIRADKADQHRKRIEALANRLNGFAKELDGIIIAYTPRPATAADQAKVERDNAPSCQSCARIEGHNGPYWSAVYRHGTCNGNLTEPMHLCSWCYTFVRKEGQLPTQRELEQHRDGIPVRRSA